MRQNGALSMTDAPFLILYPQSVKVILLSVIWIAEVLFCTSNFASVKLQIIKYLIKQKDKTWIPIIK